MEASFKDRTRTEDVNMYNSVFISLQSAWNDLFVRSIVFSIFGLLIFSSLISVSLFRSGRIQQKRYDELVSRIRSWWFLVVCIVCPILLGKEATIIGVLLLSLVCFREFARATGLFRERCISALVVLGIVLVMFAALDHWYGFFAALAPLTVIAIVALPVLQDRPSGYIQRTALGVLGFMLFGYSFGHLAYISNDVRYQAILLSIIVLTELNDVFAYVCGSIFGRRKLCPHTSPGKTVAGALGALIVTSALGAWFTHIVFVDTALDQPLWSVLFGATIAIVGQLGDLVLSSIKRDLGIKDLGTSLPGHGGFLDRFDSLTLVAPATFHFIGYFVGFGLDRPVRIITGG